MSNINRVPKGVPAGGQFSEGRRSESQTTLSVPAATVSSLNAQLAPEDLPMSGFVPTKTRDAIWDAAYEARHSGQLSEETMASLRAKLPETSDDDIEAGIDEIASTDATDFLRQRELINEMAEADQHQRGIPPADEIAGLPRKRAHPNPYGQGSYIGSRYERTRSVTGVAREVRSRLKELTRAGWLPPGLKYSVRTRRSGTSDMMTVTVQGLGDDRIFSREEPAGFGRRYTDEADELRRRVTDVVNDYNFDRSDSMTDYFDVSFYGHVRLESDSDRQARLEEAARQAAKRKSA